MKVITIRLPDELRDRLTEAAKRERRSLNSEVIVMLTTALDAAASPQKEHTS